MNLSGGQFTVRDRPGVPEMFDIEWKDAGGTKVTNPGGAGAPLPAGKVPANWEDAESDAKLRQAGEALWTFLMTGPAGEAWLAARKAPRPGVNVWRTGLNLEAAALAAYPWELLVEPGAALHAAFLDDNTFCMVSGLGDAGPLAAGWPLRVLVLKGQGRGDIIQTEREAEAIHQAWQDRTEPWRDRRHAVVIKEMLPSGKVDLKRMLGEFQPHILHFMGHAQADKLIFELPARDALPATDLHWTTNDFQTCFAGNVARPRMVWMNACRTAADKGKREPVNWGLQQMFAGLGVPVTIGMSGEVDGGLASKMAETFYRAFSRGEPADVALAEARRDAKAWRDDASRANSISHSQPFLASMMLSARASEAIQLAPATAAYKNILRDTPPLQEVARHFVDRHNVRTRLFGDMLDSAGSVQKDAQSRSLVLHGEAMSGKSWLLHSILAALASSGWLVRAHRMDGVNSLNWMDVLKLVRHGDTKPEDGHENSELLSRLPDAAFSSFDQIAAQPGPEPEQVMEAFLKGLEDLKQPVVIALDQIDMKAEEPARPDWLVQWERHFFTKLGRGRPMPVIGIAVMGANSLAKSLLNKDWRLEVGPITKEELARALRLYYCCRLEGKETEPVVVPLLDAVLKARYASAPAGGLSPYELARSFKTWAGFVEGNTDVKLPVR